MNWISCLQKTQFAHNLQGVAVNITINIDINERVGVQDIGIERSQHRSQYVFSGRFAKNILRAKRAKVLEKIDKDTQKQAFIDAQKSMKEDELKAIAKILGSDATTWRARDREPLGARGRGR